MIIRGDQSILSAEFAQFATLGRQKLPLKQKLEPQARIHSSCTINTQNYIGIFYISSILHVGQFAKHRR